MAVIFGATNDGAERLKFAVDEGATFVESVAQLDDALKESPDEVLVVITDGAVYAGSFPSNKLTVVQDYVSANRETLLARWAAFGGG